MAIVSTSIDALGPAHKTPGIEAAILLTGLDPAGDLASELCAKITRARRADFFDKDPNGRLTSLLRTCAWWMVMIAKGWAPAWQQDVILELKVDAASHDYRVIPHTEGRGYGPIIDLFAIPASLWVTALAVENEIHPPNRPPRPIGQDHQFKRTTGYATFAIIREAHQHTQGKITRYRRISGMLSWLFVECTDAKRNMILFDWLGMDQDMRLRTITRVMFLEFIRWFRRLPSKGRPSRILAQTNRRPNGEWEIVTANKVAFNKVDPGQEPDAIVDEFLKASGYRRFGKSELWMLLPKDFPHITFSCKAMIVELPFE